MNNRPERCVLQVVQRWLPISVLAVAASAPTSAAQPAGPPLNHSFIAFTIPEKDLLPENVAHDPVTGAFYIGSTRKGKIVQVDPDGTVRDFVPPRSDGLWMAIGMKVDAERRTLWVASSANGNLVDEQPEEPRSAGLFGFDLDSGRLVEKHLLEGPENHFLNDLVVDPGGNVYVTHMFDEAAIYVLRRDTGRFERFVSLEGLQYPNGIAFSGDGRTLYVANASGIAAIDVARRRVVPVTASGDANLLGIDGLYWHERALVAIHPSRQLVARYPLDERGLAVTGVEILESQHPMFRVPTTGVVVEDSLYFIANAQFESFDDDGNLWPADRLYEVVILRAPLTAPAP